MTEHRTSATRTIAAEPAEVFAALTDPTRHERTEPGEWVGTAIDEAPLTTVGQIFAMNMRLPQTGEPYVMRNLVTAFVPDTAIAWVPGSTEPDGVLRYGGWTWRYDLTPAAEGTAVTLTYDWRDVPATVKEQLGVEFPPFPPTFLEESLAALDAEVTGSSTA